MSAAIVSPTTSVNNGNNSNNTAELIYLVALFYGKGEVTTANSLLKFLNA